MIVREPGQSDEIGGDSIMPLGINLLYNNKVTNSEAHQNERVSQNQSISNIPVAFIRWGVMEDKQVYIGINVVPQSGNIPVLS